MTLPDPGGSTLVFRRQRLVPVLPCHCQARSDEAISRLASRLWFVRREIALSLRA
jgi:hypothetical protein